MNPRWYQADLIFKARAAWSEGARNVLLVSPARSGKTKMAVWLSEPFIAEGKEVFIQAHRDELVKQIAGEYAEHGHKVRILAPKETIAACVQDQIKKYGRSFIDNNARVTVGSVQTALARAESNRPWANRVALWITDEAHHVLFDNMWGNVIAMFPNALGLGFTATPARTDRKSLARSQGGVFDVMVKGVTARQLINEGYICDYRCVVPPASVDRDKIKTGNSGEFTTKGMKQASEESTITGDAVALYQKYTPGEQAIVYCIDIEDAEKQRDAFRAAGISSECVSSKTPKTIRKHLMDKFQRGLITALINVDLFGEGLNVKGISCVIMCRPTKSFVLFVQQFFRALTASDGKNMGTIIDLVGNIGHFGKFYGMPDYYNGWTLESEERGRRATRDPDIIPITTCRNVECLRVYEAIHNKCPHCGHVPEPAARSKPEHVDGDLVLMDPASLAAIFAEANRIDEDDPVIPYGATPIVEASVKKRHRERKEAQSELRDAIATWSGIWHAQGATDSEIQRRFFFKFDIDIGTAQTLNKNDATKLRERIEGAMT